MSISLDDYIAKLPTERVEAAKLAAEVRKNELIASGLLNDYCKAVALHKLGYEVSSQDDLVAYEHSSKAEATRACLAERYFTQHKNNDDNYAKLILNDLHVLGKITKDCELTYVKSVKKYMFMFMHTTSTLLESESLEVDTPKEKKVYNFQPIAKN